MFIKFFFVNVYSVEVFNINFIILIMNEGIRLFIKYLYCNYFVWMGIL